MCIMSKGFVLDYIFCIPDFRFKLAGTGEVELKMRLVSRKMELGEKRNQWLSKWVRKRGNSSFVPS